MQLDLPNPLNTIQTISCPTCDQTFHSDLRRWIHQITHDHFSDAYSTRPTMLQALPDLPGVYICLECGVYYRRKESALNTDPHVDDPVWLKRQQLHGDWVDPVIEQHNPAIYYGDSCLQYGDGKTVAD